MKEKIILVGGGGHCKACIDVIEEDNKYQIAGIVDVKEKIHQKVLNYEVIGSDEDFERLVKEYKYFLITLGHIKSAEKRITLFDYLVKLGARLPVIASPTAYVSEHALVFAGPFR